MVHCPVWDTDGGHGQKPLIGEAFITFISSSQSVMLLHYWIFAADALT